jgi:alkanesulfonate monooxygenase SsuD/methylene tetrahydromethanopterin reductase-like flavin-dependent oxidoreductase (luciferase family)
METGKSHDTIFKQRLDVLRAEGRYRIFAELERCAGRFRRAFDRRLAAEVTIWCSNDYLGMDQHSSVLAAMHAAIERSGAGAGPVMAGTPTEIADEMEAWHVAGAADGFNLMFPLLPDDWLRFAEFVVPELQRRGLTRREYASGTLRD